MSLSPNNFYDPIWQEYFDNMEYNFQSSNSQDIQNDLQLIIPDNNYGYGISDANLYTEDDYSDSDSMPDLISDDSDDDLWAMPGDADWGASCNSEMP